MRLLQPTKPLEALNSVYYEYAVVTPTDKTSRNFAFICRWFYAFVVLK